MLVLLRRSVPSPDDLHHAKVSETLQVEMEFRAFTPSRTRRRCHANSSDARCAGHANTGRNVHIRADRYPASYHLSSSMCCTATSTTPSYSSPTPSSSSASPTYIPPHVLTWRDAEVHVVEVLGHNLSVASSRTEGAMRRRPDSTSGTGSRR
jgi:hypothetical protein